MTSSELRIKQSKKMHALRRESRGVRSLQKFLIKRKTAPFAFANGAAIFILRLFEVCRPP